jgi:hypothetical protein
MWKMPCHGIRIRVGVRTSVARRCRGGLSIEESESKHWKGRFGEEHVNSKERDASDVLRHGIGITGERKNNLTGATEDIRIIRGVIAIQEREREREMKSKRADPSQPTAI